VRTGADNIPTTSASVTAKLKGFVDFIGLPTNSL
jgi:hypothetical protein